MGDESSSGIFIVLEGAIGVYMHDGDKLMHTNTLRPGESVGDVDVLDGKHMQQSNHCQPSPILLMSVPQRAFCTLIPHPAAWLDV